MDIENIKYKFALWRFKAEMDFRIKLWRKIGKLIDNGVPIITALDDIRRHNIDVNGEESPASIAITEWIQSMGNGLEFNEAIQDWVTLEERLIISSGEQNGKLSESLESAVIVMGSKRTINKAIRSAIMAPASKFGAMMGLLIYVSIEIVPKFEMLMHGRAWTGFAYVLITTCQYVRTAAPVGTLLLIAGITFMIKKLPTWDGDLRVKLDKYPPFSIYAISGGCAWMISLSALIRGGARLEDALQKIMDAAEEKGSYWLMNRTDDCLIGVRQGYSLGEALLNAGKHFPEREVISDLMTYGNLKGFDVALDFIGRELLVDTEEKVLAQSERMKVWTNVFAALLLTLFTNGMFDIQQQISAAANIH